MEQAPAAPPEGTPFAEKPSPQAGGPATLSGIALCILIALPAVALGYRLPMVGGPVFGILLGIVVGNLVRVPATATPGIKFCSKKVLQYAIIVLGGSLSFAEVLHKGAESLPVMLITLCSALAGAWLLGKALRVPRKLTSLVGVGTGICGGSAIAAAAPIMDASDDEIAFSISAVFLFNVVAVVLFPVLGHAMHMSDNGFGLWAGTAINDTSSVVAAAYSYSQQAGDYATITKLARTMMIVPVCLALAFIVGRRQCETNCNLMKIMPWFIVGFLALSVLNTVGLLGPQLPPLLGRTGKLLIVVALAGVGLGANLRNIIETGARPILLGLLVWAVVALTSLGVQYFARQL